MTQTVDHEIDDVFRVSLRADPSEIPAPLAGSRIKRYQAFVGECGQESAREERITAGLLMNELREGSGPRGRTAQGMPDELLEMFATERRQSDLSHLRAEVSDGFELAHERVGRINLVVAIGPNYQQVMEIR